METIKKLIAKILGPWKWTSPIHYLCGALTVLAGIYVGPWLAVLVFVGFLGIQIWTRKEWLHSQNDFWEYVAGIFTTTAVVLLFKKVLSRLKR